MIAITLGIRIATDTLVGSMGSGFRQAILGETQESELLLMIMKSLNLQMRPMRPTRGVVFAMALMALNLPANGQTRSAEHPRAAASMTPDAIFKLEARSVFVIEAINFHGDVLLRQSGVAMSKHAIVSTKGILESAANPTSNRGDKDIIARYRIRQGFHTWNVSSVAIDSRHDVSSFEITDGDVVPVQIGSSDSLAVGEKIFAVSFPKDQDQTLTQGSIRELHKEEGDRRIMTSVTLGPESAGGGFFDSHGKLIGIIAFDRLESLNSAVPLESLTNANIRFSGGVSTAQDSQSKPSQLWNKAAVLTHNIETFSESALISGKKTTYDEARRQIYSPDDNPQVDRLNDAVLLSIFSKESPESFDNWPVWRQSLGYMEQLRSVIGRASEDGAIDSGVVRVCVDDGRKLWSEISDVYCHEVPGARFTDLEGKTRACPQGMR